ncbi:hypothetical protein B7494_g6855 [Chlorociboria aeruginascens]|nr:hypothetical protein B7494_g6855 [Chlorociboria aeruginascens]
MNRVLEFPDANRAEIVLPSSRWKAPTSSHQRRSYHRYRTLLYDRDWRFTRENPGTDASMRDATASRVKGPMADDATHASPSGPGLSQITTVSTEEFPNSNALASSSSNNSQETTDSHDASTPPTSDGFSSQSTNPDGHLPQPSQLSPLAAGQDPLVNTDNSRPSIASTAGQKRTADGQVKPVLSSELRTRLSYAMVKVNNGWQSNSIDEVESLASQAGSPTSSNSTLHGRRNLTSPRTIIANSQSQIASEPSPTVDFDLYPGTGQQSGTYESFWRNHSTNGPPTHRQSSVFSSPTSKISLAPPADIRSTTRRSETPRFTKPPILPGGSSSFNTSTPRTPRRNELQEVPNLRTPTQKTIQEQDAIETLLFMSSPGNSGNMGHPHGGFTGVNQMSPQQSPLRTEFGQGMGRVAEKKEVGMYNDGRSRMNRESEREREMVKSKAIDKILDAMGEESSDDEELVLNYSSPRRVVA